jgi:hypothetical protein
MDWTKQLIPPITYGGRGITDEKWEKAFGPRKDGLDLHDDPVPKEDVYARKLREHWKKHDKPSKEE